MCEHNEDELLELEELDMDEEYISAMKVSDLVDLIHRMALVGIENLKEIARLKKLLEDGQLLPLSLPFMATCHVTLDSRANELWNDEMRHTMAEALMLRGPLPPYHIDAGDTLELTGPIFSLAAGLRPYIKKQPGLFHGVAFKVDQIAIQAPIGRSGEKHVLTVEDNLNEP